MSPWKNYWILILHNARETHIISSVSHSLHQVVQNVSQCGEPNEKISMIKLTFDPESVAFITETMQEDGSPLMPYVFQFFLT